MDDQMRLYHGSHIGVKNPKILTSSRIGNFGTGFYTTSDVKQARRWAQIRARQSDQSVGSVTIYDVLDSLFDNPELKVKTFDKADEAWLDFVMGNRKNPKFEHGFDLVRGPVANDRVYICLNALEDGLADRDSVIKRLKTYVLVDQILFHTAKSLLFLNYVKSEEVPCLPK